MTLKPGLTTEEFEQAANEFLAEMDRETILGTRDVRQVLIEEYNNEIIEEFESCWESPVEIDYVDMCLPDYLSNHFNGSNEMLLQAYPSEDDDNIISGFMESVEAFHDKLPANIETIDIKRAVTRFVEELNGRLKFDPNDDYSEDGEQADICIYASMTWK